MSTQIESIAGGIRVTGEMTVYTAAQLKQPLLDAVAASGANVELDLSQVSEFDTAGMQLLLLARRETFAAGRELWIGATSAVVQENLTLCGANGMRADAPASERWS
jgi:anti-sigma B factor antagonist